MKNLEHILNHAEQQCRERGSALTEKRKMVLAGLLRSERALSAYELLDVCKNSDGKRLPAMSVYRILEFLETEELVHRLKLANRYVACTHITCDHKHEVPQFLICMECQRVKEISISKSTLTTLRKNVESVGFSLVSPQLEMNCLCEECSAP